MTQQVAKPEPVKQISKRVVNECMQVQAGEQIIVLAMDHVLDYATALALEVERAGGVSTTVFQTNDFFWSYMKEIPEVQYTRRQKGYLAMLDQTDGVIALGGPKDPSIFPSVPAERTVKLFEGQKPIGDKFIERKIRVLNLPIGLVTPERARTYGFNYDNWQRITNNSLDVDYSKISAAAGKIEAKLKTANEVRITASNGTDLRFKLKNRPVHVHDGMIDRTDVEKGTIFEALPAGAVEVAPDEVSAEGMVLFDQPTALAGKMVSGMQWSFEKGRLSKYSAQANLQFFKESYESSSGDKDRLANVVIGLNPSAELIGFFTDRYVQGTVSIGIGGNKGIGGDNDAQFGHEETLRKPTLVVDGYKLISEGKIQP